MSAAGLAGAEVAAAGAAGALGKHRVLATDGDIAVTLCLGLFGPCVYIFGGRAAGKGRIQFAIRLFYVHDTFEFAHEQHPLGTD